MSNNGRHPSDDAGKQRQYLVDETRRRRARRWAAVCAFVALPLPTVLLLVGLHAGLTSIMLFAVAQFVVGWFLNHWALDTVVSRSFLYSDTGKAPGLPRYRYLVAVPAAAAVFLTVPLCVFEQEIEAEHAAARNWTARQQVLNDEDAGLRAVIGRRLPAVASDPDLVSLRDQLVQAREDWPRIRDEVICEADGRCGSGLVGRKQRYEEKVKRRDDLQKDIDKNLPQAIARRTKAVQENIDAAENMREIAARRSGEIKGVLNDPPRWSDAWDGRWQALDALDIPRRKKAVSLSVAVVIVVVHLLLDLAVLRWVARRAGASRGDDRFPPPQTRDSDGRARVYARTDKR